MDSMEHPRYRGTSSGEGYHLGNPVFHINVNVYQTGTSVDYTTIAPSGNVVNGNVVGGSQNPHRTSLPTGTVRHVPARNRVPSNPRECPSCGRPAYNERQPRRRGQAQYRDVPLLQPVRPPSYSEWGNYNGDSSSGSSGQHRIEPSRWNSPQKMNRNPFSPSSPSYQPNTSAGSRSCMPSDSLPGGSEHKNSFEAVYGDMTTLELDEEPGAAENGAPLTREVPLKQHRGE